MLSPFGNIEGLYFNNSKEPDDVMFNLEKDISRIMKADGFEYIEISCEDKADYYKIIDYLTAYNDSAIKVSGTSRDALNIIIENAEDENTEPAETSEEN